VYAVTRAVEAVSAAAENAEAEAKQDQPESFSSEWGLLWVPSKEQKLQVVDRISGREDLNLRPPDPEL
jgi:hypothetical protein